MIILEPTPKNAGVTLYGDYHDLSALHDTIHNIVTESQCDENISNFVLGLAFEIRKAKEMQRDEKEFGFDQYDRVKYRGSKLLWPYFLLQVQLLRQLCSYCPTTKADQAQLYLLESKIEETLVDIDAAIGSNCLKWFKIPTMVNENFYFIFVDAKVLQYLTGPQGKARFKKLPGIMSSINPLHDEYAEYSALLEEQARTLGCSPHGLEDNEDWPEFQW